jgi:hypothetical protein
VSAVTAAAAAVLAAILIQRKGVATAPVIAEPQISADAPAQRELAA